MMLGETWFQRMSPQNTTFASGTATIRSPPVCPSAGRITILRAPSQMVIPVRVVMSGSGTASIRARYSGVSRLPRR